MRSRRRVPRAFAAVCAAAMLAACTGHAGSNDTSPTPGDGMVGGPGLDPHRQPPAPDVEGASSGGVVKVIGCCFEHPDPSETYWTDTTAILSGLVTRSLTQYVWDPESQAMVLIPDLATDLGRPNDDYTQWTFTIRSGVRFEDGTAVTAADVAYGIKRSMDSGAFPTGPSWGNDYFLHGDTYKGLYHGGTDYDGVAVDGQTLTIRMAKPFPDMPYYGAFPEMGPIPQSGSEPATYRLHPLATGPYKVKDFVPHKSLRLVRNERWDPDTDPGRHQYVDEFDFTFTQHTNAAWPDLLADADSAQTSLSYSDMPAGVLQRARQTAADRIVSGPTGCEGIVWPDYRKIDDVDVRRALGEALPYRRLWRAAHLVPGATAFPGSSILPPATPGRVDYNPLPTQPGATDPARARALLARAGADGYRIEFAVDASNAYNVESGKIVKRGLERAGFTVAVDPVPNSDAFNRLQADANAPVNLRRGGLCPDWQSGLSWLQPYLSPSNSLNFGYFDEPEVAARARQILQMPLAAQAAAWGALDQTIQQKYYPVIVVRYWGNALLPGSRLGGVNLDPVLDMPTLKDIYVIPERDG